MDGGGHGGRPRRNEVDDEVDDDASASLLRHALSLSTHKVYIHTQNPGHAIVLLVAFLALKPSPT